MSWIHTESPDKEGKDTHFTKVVGVCVMYGGTHSHCQGGCTQILVGVGGLLVPGSDCLDDLTTVFAFQR